MPSPDTPPEGKVAISMSRCDVCRRYSDALQPGCPYCLYTQEKARADRAEKQVGVEREWAEDYKGQRDDLEARLREEVEWLRQQQRQAEQREMWLPRARVIGEAADRLDRALSGEEK